jgi:hypothetical protein
MKKVYLIIFISLFIYIPESHSQEHILTNFNGWEFLNWKCKKTDTENILNKKGIEFRKMESYDSTRTITRFDFEELDTWLYFDTLNQLFDVKQSRYFSVIYDKESKAFFDKVKKSLLQKYGKANEEKDDKEKEIITMIWKLNFTIIHLTFDYKYKIIDEFGCCAYQIDIDICPNK